MACAAVGPGTGSGGLRACAVPVDSDHAAGKTGKRARGPGRDLSVGNVAVQGATQTTHAMVRPNPQTPVLSAFDCHLTWTRTGATIRSGLPPGEKNDALVRKTAIKTWFASAVHIDVNDDAAEGRASCTCPRCPQ